MDEEYFYGATLDKAKASITWNFNESGDEYQGPNYKLFIRQILLGHTAKPDEFNVVEVEAITSNDVVKIPIGVLQAGKTRSITLNLEFPDAPVTFKLIEGNGPVYIHGHQVPVFIESVDDEMDDEAAEEEQEEESKPVNKKRKISENSSNAKATNGSSENTKNPKKSVK